MNEINVRRERLETLQWGTEELATMVDPSPVAEPEGGGLEWDANEGATIDVSVPLPTAQTCTVQWMETVQVRGMTTQEMPAARVTQLGLMAVDLAEVVESSETRQWPKVDAPPAEAVTSFSRVRPQRYVRRAERYVPPAPRNDREKRPRRLMQVVQAVGPEHYEPTEHSLPRWPERARRERLGALVSLAGWGVAAFAVTLLLVRVPVRRAAAVPAAPAPVAAVAAVAAAPVAASGPAVLEAVDALSVRATAATAGTVRRSLPRGSAVAVGDTLVELKRASADAGRLLDELNELLEEYDGTGTHATEIAQARAAYQRAATAPAAGALHAAAAGVVVGETPRPGTTLEAGDEVTRVAASVRLLLAAGDVAGTGAACRVVLLDRKGLILDGRLLPGLADARSRTITVKSFPAELPLGTVGRARAVCD